MRRDVHRKQATVSLAILAGAAATAALMWAPWYLAFPGSVGSAVAWCIWLERHPP
jgi:hypothetical protein